MKVRQTGMSVESKIMPPGMPQTCTSFPIAVAFLAFWLLLHTIIN